MSSVDTDAAADLAGAGLTAVTSTDPATRAEHAHDRSGAPTTGIPDAVVFAESTAHVVALLRVAAERGLRVVPRGAGTGLAGGATAHRGEVVLSTERMNRIVEVSATDRLARVQAGVLTAEVDAAAAAVGLSYAPDPGSVTISTIGGNIATNAGGLRCVKYGVTGDSVLGLQAVLAGGEVIETGSRTVKSVTGLDLTSLLVGSEGTLAVITEATVRLRPIPPETVTVVATYASAHAAARAAQRVQTRGVTPAALELLDATCLSALDAMLGTDLRDRGAALLMVRTDGWAAAAEARVCAAALTDDATSVTVVDDPAAGGALVDARRNALPALERLGRVLIEDVAVPVSALGTMVERIGEIAGRHGVTIATMAHAGDGNLHPIIVCESDTVGPAAWDAADEIFSTALHLGGTLTGEHGVGTLKRQWLDRELGAGQRRLMTDIKRAFDPAGILNPGRAI
ncbi:FAD-binding oxidoreductase [Gordonia sp. NPDC003376]